MATRTILASFDNLQQARRAVHDLEVAGVPRRKISIATPSQTAGERAEPSVDRQPTWGWRVGLLCAALGASVVFGAVVVANWLIPSFGPPLALGALFATLGALMGGVVGFVLGDTAPYPGPAAADRAWDEACQQRLQRGDVVVAVSTDEEKAGQATAVLSPQGAREVCRVG
jgi:hypothetical protein